MDEDKYRVVFDGSITDEYPLDITIKRFAKYFKLSNVRAKQFFSGKAQVVKSGLSEESAMKLAMAIATIGGECVIELVPLDDDLSHQPGFVERRKVADRRIIPSRRKTERKASQKPDRRQNNGRRRTDKQSNSVVQSSKR